ncbi:MAG: hypothetical protein KKC51_12970 [Verrucomicrobia bacterium]|nr:hypothetical protein [Verrucomicrobiota bacterium]
MKSKSTVGLSFVMASATILVLALAPTAQGNGNVYVSRFWHNHQPIYWPEWNGNGSQTERIQYAWDSIVLKDGQTYGTSVGHPENNLSDIFGLDDRRAAYQGRPRDSLANINSAGGFAISYSGSLIDNVRNLGGNGQLGYGSGWWDGNREARNWTTPSGSRRLDLVGFTYHHSLGPLLPKAVFRKELQIFKQAWWKAWGGQADLSDHSKGFFPTEMAFSRHLVDVLVDEGYEWSIVASHHLSRTCPTYLNNANPTGSYNIYSSPPNQADRLGPSPTTGWWYSEPNPGNAAWNVAPYAYQLHKVKYVNPETGAEKSLIVVPSDDVLSYRNGYANEGISKIQSYISPYATDPSRPVIVMPATDGDNAWGGGFSSWMEATPQFFNESGSAGYHQSTPQDFVNAHGAAADTVHVEDGGWIFPEMDYGSPYFLKWIEPPVNDANLAACYPGTKIDMETPGFALKFWSWAPVISGANWCETAEQMLFDEGTNVQPWKIQAIYDWDGSPTSPNLVERAWHVYLAGLDSGFNYYGGLGNDDEVKQSLATARAIALLQTYVNDRLADDRTAPTVLKPQRFPYNPGWYTFGWFNSIPEDSRFLKKMGSEFYVWTHAYDVSGITSITVKVRLDGDGVNSMANNHNELYAGGGDVGAWISVPMTKRTLPKTREELNAAASNGQIDYFITSPEIADYYFAKITSAGVPNFRGKLLDYYIEAVDTRGNTNRTDIQQVFVEDDGGGGVVSYATFSGDPRDCAPLVVTYSATGGVLQGVSPVYQQISFDNGTNWTRYQMNNAGADLWVCTNTVPDNAPSALVWFEDTAGTIADSNGGANWYAAIRDCDAPTGPGTAETDPPSPGGCGAVQILYHPNAGVLKDSANIKIHVGYNGWQDVVLPNPSMTKSNNNTWVYTYNPPAGTYQIDVVFNDGGGIWDNNSKADWHFFVTDCPGLPAGIVITNPPADPTSVTTTVATLSGTAGEGISGHLRWTNALTGDAGTVAAATYWTIASIPLNEGTNLITIAGSNTASQVVTKASDAADASAYDPSWDSDDNAGTGFRPWTNFSEGANAGHFRATKTGNPFLMIGNYAWGLWANSQQMAEGARHLSNAVAVGETFSLKFQNGGVDGTGGVSSVGIAFQNNATNDLLRFLFAGGQANYTLADNSGDQSTGIGWTSNGLDIVVRRSDTTNYILTVHPYGSATSTFTGTLIITNSDAAIRRLRVWNYNSGVNGENNEGRNFYVNDLRVQEDQSSAVVTGDSVRVVLASDGNGDGLPDWWQRQYWGSEYDPDAAWDADEDEDGFPNYQEYRLGTNPRDPNSGLILRNGVVLDGQYPRINWISVGGRGYSLQFSTNLLTPGGGFVQFLEVTETAADGVETNRAATHNLPLPATGARQYRVKLLSP